MPFRWDDCLELHIPLGLFFSLASCVLLGLTTFSAPYSHRLYFLAVPDPVGLKLGAFGTCSTIRDGACSGKMLGYAVQGGQELKEWMTRAFILFPIAGLFILFAFLFLVLSLMKCGEFMWNPIYFRVSGLIATLLAIIAEIFALIAFVQARHRWNEAGVRPVYGSALWTGLGGAASAFLAVCLGGPQYEARFMYRAHPAQSYHL